jgi:predicted membrane protein
MPFLSLILTVIVIGAVAWLINNYVPLSNQILTIVNVVLALIVVGIVLWLINTYVPMAGSIKAILNIVVVIATCVKVLQALGLWAGTVRLWNGMKSRVARASRPEDESHGEHPTKEPWAA